MIRSVLALAALLALAASSGIASACPMHGSDSKQTLASVDGKSSKPIIAPSNQKDG
jgi:ABC-type oligopeptide transport system substrate-binding subunit